MRGFMTKHGVWTATVVGLVLAVITFFAWVNPGLWSWLAANPAVGWVSLLVSLVAIAFLVSERWRLEGEVAALTKPTSTARDREAFAAILADWPLVGRGTYGYLSESFFGKQFHYDRIEPMVTFLHVYQDAIFDDAAVEEAFTDFYKACTELNEWMVNETDDVSDEGARTSVHRLIEARFRPDGQEGWERARAQGRKRAAEVVAQRLNFERAGRARGL